MSKPLTDAQKNMILEYAEHDGQVLLTKDEVHSLIDELLVASREMELARDGRRHAQDAIEIALYELQGLERNLNMPDRGYVRNCFNSVVRTLQEPIKHRLPKDIDPTE